jgi:hypothetical protein
MQAFPRQTDIGTPFPTAHATLEYREQRASLATMHGKEIAIAMPMATVAQMTITVPTSIDTDRFGTFTGDIRRPGNMLETAIAKARCGMALMKCQIGIASEGSYGPHPAMPMLAVGQELMVLVDDRHGIVMTESLQDDAPTYDHIIVGAGEDLSRFLIGIGFPSQALIVRPHQDAPDATRWHRGIRTISDLTAALKNSLEASCEGRAFVQTDMRASCNPRRMAMIARLARRLATRLANRCPACAAPGFGLIGREAGLPCRDCGMPTDLVRAEIYGCTVCGLRQPQPRSDGIRAAPASSCLNCNP